MDIGNIHNKDMTKDMKILKWLIAAMVLVYVVWEIGWVIGERVAEIVLLS